MRGLGVSAAAVVFGASAFFGMSGRWPWQRLNSQSVAPVVIPQAPVNFTEIKDTLRRGETLSDLFDRHDINFDFNWLDSSSILDPRRVRAGLIFSFRQLLGDSAPNHIAVRTSPEQRIIFSRISDRWSASSQPIRWQKQ